MGLQEEVKTIISGLENPDGSGIPKVFYDKAVYNKEKSEEEGRPVYDDVLYLRKHVDKLNTRDARAESIDIKNYPREYELYLRNKEERESGVPIGMLPALHPSELKVLEDCRIYTVEKLADAPKDVIDMIQGKHLQERAMEYLQKSDKIAELQEENEALKAEIKKLKEAKNDSPNNGAKRSRRNNSVRATNNSNKQQQSGNETGSKLSKEGS